MSELVSVLMVVKNEENFIDQAIEAVVEQSYVNFELIVVDGRSTDKTRDRVVRWAETDERVRLVDNPNSTIPWGLNCGLAEARGDYIARLDGHSAWPPNFLRTALDLLAHHPEVGGVGGMRLGVGVSATGRSIAAALSSTVGVGNSIYHYSKREQKTDHVTCGVYRREAVAAVGGWDTSLMVNEDVDFDHQILRSGWLLHYTPGLVTHWRVRESLSALLRQYRRYGRGKAQMVRKNGMSAMRVRHLAAPALVVGLSVLVPWSLLRRDFRIASPAAIYVAAILCEGKRAARGSGGAVGSRVTLALACMHVGWGCGFLEAFLLGAEPHASSQAIRGRLTQDGGRRRNA